MSLSQKIAVALERAEADTLPCDVVADDATNRLVVHLTASGPVGLAFSSLEFHATADPEWTPAALRSWGDRIAARVTYLMEPLVVLEQDALGGEVEIRSQSPTSRGDRRAYYEIRIARGGALHLTRVAFDDATRRRRPVDCMMTCEVLERLTDDLAACLP